ncbi:hypothetical protein B0I35DRAFT_485380 [Stachybotrys elegans]|uniref:Extracellular membrane protein CFEM domain-containing protein n=1 Tax=Stachybotrys elegans TaxID=80388 RepID=A0A8K0SAG1_9HYPO|nr:hypothetical protein B0I35DRAFT_485380 [Stachybotrys elegans]
MVRLFILAVIATAISAVAADSPIGTSCQCLYSDGSHCCVAFGVGACRELCSATSCNAGGNWSHVSWFTGLGRHKC